MSAFQLSIKCLSCQRLLRYSETILGTFGQQKVSKVNQPSVSCHKHQSTSTAPQEVGTKVNQDFPGVPILPENVKATLDSLTKPDVTENKFVELKPRPKVADEPVKDFNEIPGPKSLPLVGTLYQYLPWFGPYRFDRLHHNGLEKYKKFGPIVREEIVKGVNIVWLFKPEDIELLFRTEGKYPERRSHLALEKYRLDRPEVYKTGGLLPTNGETWHSMRMVFQRGLTSPVAVTNFIPASDEIISEFVKLLGDESKADWFEDDCLPMLSRLFLELTCQSFLDHRLNSFSVDEMRSSSDSTKLIKAAYDTNTAILKTDNGLQLWKHFPTPLYRRLRSAQKIMEEFAIDKLQLKMIYFGYDTLNPSKTLLETYLSSKELDFRDIIGIICDFLLAGIDTSTYTVSFLLYHLANSPNVQEELYEESVKLLPKQNTPITKDILNEAKYAKAVLKESLRLRPVSVGVGRVLSSDQVFSGYLVPKGTVIVTQNQVSCRLEKYFENPHEFIPERWLKSSKKKYHPFLSLPFGHGARSCIARRLAEQNMQMLLMRICRTYRMKWNGGVLDSKSLLINQPDGPIDVEFQKR